MVAASAVNLPRVVIAAPASGHGKTTLATGLMAALRQRGRAVSPHKVGPDYIDPGYHTLAAGRPGRNLDPWLVGEHRVLPLLLHGATTPHLADLAVIEGVMGLHDGAAGRGEFASTAHVARLLGAPVVLVIDTTGQGRSAAACALGMHAFDPAVRLAGVILNRVGSPRHETLLREAFAEVKLPVLGAVRGVEDLVTPSRHLGLIPAAEREEPAIQIVEALGSLVDEAVDLDALLAIAGQAPPLPAGAWDPVEAVGGPVTGTLPRIAVAAGVAFTFSYPETAILLEAAGAAAVPFDPRTDRRLPPGTRGIVLGGGFPEVHAEALASNQAMRADIAAFDGPIVAECAGLLYLGQRLDGAPMCGRLPVTASMTPRLTLGYRDAVAPVDSCVTVQNQAVRGHEFHRTTTDPVCGRLAAWTWDGRNHGFVDHRVHASYLHLHWAGCPSIARRLVAACL
ncbi:MAG: cobyrinate a,c-diamide synthase [Micromonosporaceae bacterium]|nr:cobyrinate a,c-diamide synthase [Micromonosporaceae bacterium]